MKKLLVIIFIIGVVVLGYLSVRTYNAESDRRAAQSAAQQAEAETLETDRRLRNQQAEVIIAECKRVLDSYQKLTPSERAKTPAPDCAIEKLQVE